MDGSIASERKAEAGFLLIEAVIAVALIAVCAGTSLAALAAVTRAQAHALPTPALTLCAQNVLTDLRAATAYDPAALAQLAGRSVSFDADEPAGAGPARRTRITISISGASATEPAFASVTARSTNGSAVSIRAALVQEAPAPGSIVSADTLSPAAEGCSAQGPAATCAADPSPIPL